MIVSLTVPCKQMVGVPSPYSMYVWHPECANNAKWSCLPHVLSSKTNKYLYIDMVMNLYSIRQEKIQSGEKAYHWVIIWCYATILKFSIHELLGDLTVRDITNACYMLSPLHSLYKLGALSQQHTFHCFNLQAQQNSQSNHIPDLHHAGYKSNDW